MKAEQAIGIGQDALVWLIGQPERFEGFLAGSGASVVDLRAGADDPDFLGFVLDFILQSDAAVLAFSGALGIAPDRAARARAALPGGYAPDWT